MNEHNAVRMRKW